MDKPFKSLSFTNIKSQAQGRERAGICAVLGNIDDGDDITHRGAFTKTLNEGRKRFKHLWNHESWNTPTAEILDIYEVERHELPKEILDFAPDAEGGLYVKRRYLNNQRAEEVLECIDAGIVDEMSYAYDVVKSDNSEVNGVKIRNLRELILYDTSDVNFGMNPATVGSGMKSYVERLPLAAVVSILSHHSDLLKAGRRNSESDIQLINLIHSTVVDLGAKCSTEQTDEPKSNQQEKPEEKAEAVEDTSLGQNWLDLQKLELESLGF